MREFGTAPEKPLVDDLFDHSEGLASPGGIATSISFFTVIYNYAGLN